MGGFAILCSPHFYHSHITLLCVADWHIKQIHLTGRRMVTVLDAEWQIQPSVTIAVIVCDELSTGRAAAAIRLTDLLIPGATTNRLDGRNA